MARPRIVAAQVVELKNIPSQVTAYGRLMSAQQITLFSEVSGEIMRGGVPFQPAQSFYFLSRPRRFGKSLMVSTLGYLFQGRKDLVEWKLLQD